MITHASRVAVAALLLALSVPVLAATYIIPPDAEFIRSADAIAIVNIESSRSYYGSDGTIWTDFSATVERTLKSPLKAGTKITVVVHGGMIGNIGYGVSNAPSFSPSERTLLVMRRLQPGRFATASGELGKFSFVSDSESRSLLVRGASDDEIFGWDRSGRRHIEQPRDAAQFLAYIEAIVAGDTPSADYFVRESVFVEPQVRANSHVGPYEYSVAVRHRAQDGAFSMQSVNNQGSEDGGSVFQNAAAMWNNISEANINVSYGGVNPAGGYNITFKVNGKDQPDQANFIIYDRSEAQVPDLSGSTVGIANYWYDTQSPHTNPASGASHPTLADCDIAVESGFSGSLLNAIVGHEIGHCLGFRHSNQPQSGQTTNTGDALMNSSVGPSSTIRDWDTDAATHMYGTGQTVCNAVTIQSHPQSTTIVSGSSTTLNVTAAGTGPFTYQWFTGTSGDTSNPIGGQTSAGINVNPSTTTSYWVRVGQACGPTTVNSNAATVTVTPFVCPQVTVGTPVAQQLNATQYRLSVSANSSGTPIASIEWYQGNNPGGEPRTYVGTGTPTVAAPTVNTSYWASVTNNCGNSAFSSLVTIVGVCPTPVITTQPGDQTVNQGQSATLNIAFTPASGTTVTWYLGNTGDKTTQVGTGATFNTGALNATTRYWANLVNSCGESQSRTVTVTVNIVCTGPAITAQSPAQKISLGKTVTLSVTATGTGPLTYQWYEGTVGTITKPVGTNASTFTSAALSNTTQFWVKVTNGCGSVNSAAFNVTVDKGRKRAVGHR